MFESDARRSRNKLFGIRSIIRQTWKQHATGSSGQASPAQTSMMIWMLSAKDSTIRVPIHMIEAINKMVRTRRQMFNEIGREPTPEELGKKLGMADREGA
jgi:hypothetical protein